MVDCRRRGDLPGRVGGCRSRPTRAHTTLLLIPLGRRALRGGPPQQAAGGDRPGGLPRRHHWHWRGRGRCARLGHAHWRHARCAARRAPRGCRRSRLRRLGRAACHVWPRALACCSAVGLAVGGVPAGSRRHRCAARVRSRVSPLRRRRRAARAGGGGRALAHLRLRGDTRGAVRRVPAGAPLPPRHVGARGVALDAAVRRMVARWARVLHGLRPRRRAALVRAHAPPLRASARRAGPRAQPLICARRPDAHLGGARRQAAPVGHGPPARGRTH
mmetsp:Transcript_11367/g.35049  ORF Transcript_11367/g.35049 Transcript_11367/m.35049 type:complete len:274 (-) Transcript_11367:1441-2262(-)